MSKKDIPVSRRQRRDERGFVLIIVLLLIIMVSGLALMAVRHSQQEAHAMGAYVDSTQAVALVEGGLAVAITDLRTASDYYRQMFSDTSSSGAQQVNDGVTDMWRVEYEIPLSPTFFEDGADACADVDTDDSPDGCIGDLTNMDAGNYAAYKTMITYNLPVVGPCPPGYSCFDEQNYGWYVFGINVITQFGTQAGFWNTRFVETSRAQGAGRVTIGPIGAYGN